jgi:hypothetical protein
MTGHPVIADLERVEPRGMAMHRFLTRALAVLRRHSLDRELARGVDPASSPGLALRASRLTRSRSRQRLARSLRDVIADAQHPPRVPSARVAPSRAEVLDARESLREVQDLLASSAPVYAAGIARLKMLLTDGVSPLYTPRHRGELGKELERILAGLEGRMEDW